MPPWWSRSAVLLAMHPGTQLWRSLKELSGLLSCVFCGGEPSVKNQGSRCRESGQFKVDQNMALYASLSARNTCLADFCLPGSFNFIFFPNPSVYSHASCQGFLPCQFLPFRSIHLHILFQNLSRAFPVLVVANTGSCMGPWNKIGHPAHRYRQLMQVIVLTARGIYI